MMEVVQASSVKIPNSVIVSGVDGTDTDEELYDFLKQYGSIHRIVEVESPESETGKQVIVEYVSGAALQSLSPMLPYELHGLHAKTQTDITYHIRSLASAYTPVASKLVTQTYLSELKEIAKLTGRDLAAVLKEELSVISEAVDLETTEAQIGGIEPNPLDTPEQHVPGTAAQISPLLSTVHKPYALQGYSWSPPKAPSEGKAQPAPKLPDINPPEVQRVIVEHIVRNEESAMQIHTPLRLRPFSGRCPHPNNEVDYETWRSNVELLLKDTKQPDLYKSRKVLESLLSPAIDIVKHLTPESPPSMYLNILDSAFSTVEDGDDCFARYLNTMQDNGEKPSVYLQRLQVMLNAAFRRGGVPASDLDRQLLRQFVRGCWDNILISELQLEQKKQNPPTFAELLLLIRTAEDKRISKASRMKQYFNVSKQKVSSHYQGAYFQYGEECTQPPSVSNSKIEIQDLKRQIADLQSQLTRITQRDSRKTPTKPAAKPSTSKSVATKSSADTTGLQKPQLHSQDANHHKSTRPKPWYCFRCGEDGHIKPQCDSEPNPSLVAKKQKQLKEKQLAWDVENSTPKPDHLN